MVSFRKNPIEEIDASYSRRSPSFGKLICILSSHYSGKRNPRSRHGKSFGFEDAADTLTNAFLFPPEERQPSPPQFRDHLRGARDTRDAADEDLDRESEEEMALIEEVESDVAHDSFKRKTEVMSITEDQDTLPMLGKKAWHIGIFGELIHDDEGQNPANFADADVMAKTRAKIVANVTDVKFTPNGNEIIARDYLTVKQI